MPEIKHEVKPEPSTTTTSTSVIIPPNQPIQKTYTEWEMVGLFVAGVIATITIAGGILGIYKFFYDLAKERKENQKKENEPIEERFEKIENEIKEFLSSEKIDKEFTRLDEKFDHYKGNIGMMIEGINTRVNSQADTLAAVQRSITKFETQFDNVNTTMKRLEDSLDKTKDRMDERFDDLRDLLIKEKA